MALDETYTQIRKEVAFYLGYSTNSSDWTSRQAENISFCLNDGLRRFYNPQHVPTQQRTHTWSFLSPQATLTTTAPYDTGTVSITAGVVTLTGGTFPTYDGTAMLRVESGTYAGSFSDVASRDSSTQLTLTDTTITSVSGADYSLGFPTYDLPSDFGGMTSEGFVYAPGSFLPQTRIVETSEENLRAIRSQFDWLGYPRLFALAWKTTTGSAPQGRQITFNPIPQQAFTFTYRYRRRPSEIDGTYTYIWGANEHGNTILEACLAAAEEKLGDNRGVHNQRFMEALAASIDLDQRMNTPTSLGRGRLQTDDESRYSDYGIVSYPITIELNL